MPSFADLRVPEPLLQALAGLRYREPTPIQAAAIPPLLAGRDLLGQAETGTGKTAAYGVPLAAATRAGVLGALVLVPTRELALQVTEALNAIGSTVGVRAVAVYGGVGYGRQGEALASGETTCVVATPGRLIDLLQQRALALDEVRFVVIDEADRMLDMGFLPDVERLFQQIPGKRQTVLMSATLPPDVQRLARHLLRDPVRVDVTGSALAAPLVEARYLVLDELDKPLAVQAYLEAENPFDILLFVSTRERADMVAQRLRKLKVDAAPFHGGIPQGKRERTLSSFVEGDVRVLVATDLAARGIDVRNLACVLNYDLPENTEAYVHRIGRTGRAGKRGVALSFVTPREVPALRAIARDAGTPLVPQRLPGFGERE